MKDTIKELVYRGAKYSIKSITNVSKKYFRNELFYRGTKYVEEIPQKINLTGIKMNYRGVSY